MDRYDAHEIEARWQAVWEDEQAFHAADPEPGRRRGALLHARDAAVPVRAAAHGARPQLHDGRRRHALPPAHRPRGAAPDGLRLVRPARRERRDPRRRSPARDHRAEHRHDHEPDAPHGLGDRLAARGVRARADLLPLDAVALPEVPGARARVPQGGAGQLVPERPDRARERARRRREAAGAAAPSSRRGTWRSGSSRSPRTPTSCSTTWRRSTGRSARRRSRRTGSAGRTGRRCCSASTSSTSTSPSSRRGPTRCSARRSSSSRRSRRSSTSWSKGPSRPTKCARTRASRPRVRPRSASSARRPACSPGRYATNPVNGERIPIWVADYVLMEYGTGAIMAVPAHDERDAEFAAAFALPVVAVISEDGTLVNSGEFDGQEANAAKAAIVQWLSEHGRAQAGDQLPPARLELLAPALLGRADPGRLLRGVRDRAAARERPAACCCRRSRTTARRASRRSRPTRSS